MPLVLVQQNVAVLQSKHTSPVAQTAPDLIEQLLAEVQSDAEIARRVGLGADVFHVWPAWPVRRWHNGQKLTRLYTPSAPPVQHKPIRPSYPYVRPAQHITPYHSLPGPLPVPRAQQPQPTEALTRLKLREPHHNADLEDPAAHREDDLEAAAPPGLCTDVGKAVVVADDGWQHVVAALDDAVRLVECARLSGQSCGDLACEVADQPHICEPVIVARAPRSHGLPRDGPFVELAHHAPPVRRSIGDARQVEAVSINLLIGHVKRQLALIQVNEQHPLTHSARVRVPA
mmetsp:Transcript_9901/g.30268  ORF Transcript_9901/g.30268 Transcript_9901/m.30268 type:complete len:287 (-) Transcript_9901:99-959(-)